MRQLDRPDVTLALGRTRRVGATRRTWRGSRLRSPGSAGSPRRTFRRSTRARAVVALPSLEEGFGLPVLEAMASGAAVVTSAGSATEEVAGRRRSPGRSSLARGPVRRDPRRARRARHRGGAATCGPGPRGALRLVSGGGGDPGRVPRGARMTVASRGGPAHGPGQPAVDGAGRRRGQRGLDDRRAARHRRRLARRPGPATRRARALRGRAPGSGGCLRALEVLADDGANKVRRVLAEQTWLARAARRCGAEVVHHAGGTVPFTHPGHVVLTIQDLQPLDMPRNFLGGQAVLPAHDARSVRAGRRGGPGAQRVHPAVGSSSCSGSTPDRVHVVAWAARRPTSGPSIDLVAARAAGVVPDAPYLLYPAITYSHKNHRVLLEAVAQQLHGPARDSVLVLTGGSAGAEAEVAERIDTLGLTERVWRTGRVGQERLDALYAGASAVVVPSRYEGFGLPALEAMQRGCPVVVARAGSLPEVVGGGVLGRSRRCDSVDGRHAGSPVDVGRRAQRTGGARSRAGGPLHLGTHGRGPARRVPFRPGGRSILLMKLLILCPPLRPRRRPDRRGHDVDRDGAG
jgi:glycosyltransferase involved in cell wall biosynthesis